MTKSEMSALRAAVNRRQIGAIRLLLPGLTSRMELLMVAGSAEVHATPDGAQWAASLASDRPWMTPSVSDSVLLVEAGRLLHLAESFGFMWRLVYRCRPLRRVLGGAQ